MTTATTTARAEIGDVAERNGWTVAPGRSDRGTIYTRGADRIVAAFTPRGAVNEFLHYRADREQSWTSPRMTGKRAALLALLTTAPVISDPPAVAPVVTTRTHWRLSRDYYAVLDGREVVRITRAILGERPTKDDGRPDYSVGLPILAVEVEHLHPEHRVGLGEIERIDDVAGRLVEIEPVDARARDIRKALKAAGADLTDVRITSGRQNTWVRVEGYTDTAQERGAALFEILRTLWHDGTRRVRLIEVTGSVVIERAGAYRTFPLSAIPARPEPTGLDLLGSDDEPPTQSWSETFDALGVPRDPEAALDALFEQGRAYGAPEPAGEGSTDGPARTVRPRQRMRFVHSRRLAKVDGQPVATWPHQVYEVTAVRGGTVYYREPGQTGAGWTVPEDGFDEAVLEILADYPDQTEPCAVEDLRKGDVFSADEGATWHTCAVVGWGTVSVYCDARRDDEAPTRRIALERVEQVWRGCRS